MAGTIADVRVLTLNLGHGRGQTSHQVMLKPPAIRDNLDRIAAMLREQCPDVVGLQEADGPSWWSGNFDHVRYLADRAEFPHMYRGAHRKIAQIECGTSLLAREPLEDRFCKSLWSGALRPMKGFVVAAMGGIDFASVHIDFMTRTMRRKQLGRMATMLHERQRPLVILGDLNCSWTREPTLRELATRLDLAAFEPESKEHATFPASKPRRRIDWILASRSIKIEASAVVDAYLSDHRAVVADLSF